jgi:hypothetical protein
MRSSGCNGTGRFDAFDFGLPNWPSVRPGHLRSRHHTEKAGSTGNILVFVVGAGRCDWVGAITVGRLRVNFGGAKPDKSLGMMVARDGVERFGVPCFQQVTDSTKDTKDTEDRKGKFCVRFVCGFSFGENRRNSAASQTSSASPGASLITTHDHGIHANFELHGGFLWIH